MNIAVGSALITRRTCLESASATEYLYFCPNRQSQQPAWSKQHFMLICRSYTHSVWKIVYTHFCIKYAKVIAITRMYVHKSYTYIKYIMRFICNVHPIFCAYTNEDKSAMHLVVIEYVWGALRFIRHQNQCLKLEKYRNTNLSLSNKEINHCS